MRSLYTALLATMLGASFGHGALAQNTGLLFDREIAFEDMTPAQITAARQQARRHKFDTLRVCADPGNMPLSNVRREGLQNRIIETVAEKMGATVSYFWRPYLERGITRQTFDDRVCDILIEVPYSYDRVLTTLPIYRSTYVFATRSDSGIEIDGFDDPDLKEKRIGVFQHSGMRDALARHGIKEGLDLHVISYDADLNEEHQPWRQVQEVVDGQLDIAAVWGPFAGWVKAQGAPIDLTPANLMEDRIVLEFDLSFGLKSNDVVQKFALEFAMFDAEEEIEAILRDFGVPLVQCSKCVVRGDLPAHGSFFEHYNEIPQDRFTKVMKADRRRLDLALATPNQIMTVEKLERALEKGADVQDEFANAVLGADRTRIAYLLDRGADVNAPDKQGAPALFTAVKGRNPELIAHLLDEGADITITDKAGMSAIHHAVIRNHVPTVEILAERGADLSVKGPSGLTPLGLAISEGRRWAASALVKGGAPVDQTFAEDELTPLMILATQGPAHDRDARVAGGPSVLEIVELLIANGADVNATTRHGVTALMIAAGHNNLAVLSALMKAGADPQMTNNAGNTASKIAELARNTDVVKALRVLAMTSGARK